MASDRTRNVWTIALAASAVIFFLGANLFWLTGAGSIYVSPDETANAWFINLFASTGSFRFEDDLNGLLDNTVHPRSMVVWQGITRPIGFLGLPILYGAITFLVGSWIIPILTPLIALAAVFAWRAILQKSFDERVANVATIVLFSHPALWYYAARGLMPNVLFVSLLVFAFFFWVRRPLQPWVSILLSGLMLGFALSVRASELPWIALVVLVLFIYARRSTSCKELGLFLVGCIVGLLSFFVMNELTYIHPLVTGYTLPVIEQNLSMETTSTKTNLLLPFGIEPRAIAKNVLNYGLLLFWWLSIPAALGFLVALVKKQKAHPHTNVYLTIFVLLAVWLGVYYGSWDIHDNPDPTQVTIANSYVRYWLPIFLLSTPLVALSFVWIQDRFKQNVLPFLLIVVVLLGMQSTFFTGQDGLLNVRESLIRSAEIRRDVLLRVEPESLIIVDRADKLFFPHRVLYPLRSEHTYALMPIVVEHVPLYYYGITFPDTDLTYLNERKLKSLGLHIDPIQTFDEESLYSITKP